MLTSVGSVFHPNKPMLTRVRLRSSLRFESELIARAPKIAKVIDLRLYSPNIPTP